jgi:phosphatidylglycerophosphate synthase
VTAVARPTLPSVLLALPPLDPSLVIGGLSLPQRIARAATATGYTHLTVDDVDVARDERRSPDASAVRLVLLPANVVPLASWLTSLATLPEEPETLRVDSSLTMVVDTRDMRAVLAAVRRCPTIDKLVAELRDAFAERPWPLDPTGRFPLSSADDVVRAESWLLRSLIKQREGFMSRHFERRISLAVTRRLAPTRVTPDVMTLVSAAVGFASAPFFLSSRASLQLTGALLFLAHSILDGCDGELARLKFLMTRRGAVLDYWADCLVHTAVFAAMAIGWSHAVGASWPLVLGAVATTTTLASSAVMFERTAQDRALADDAATRLIERMSSRDFIYVIILLSAFGHATWFLVAVAFGAPGYFVAALWLSRRGAAGAHR